MNKREFLTRSGITVTSLGVSQVLHGRRLAAKTGSLSKCHNANVPQRVAEHTERPKRNMGRRPVVQLFDLKEDGR